MDSSAEKDHDHISSVRVYLTVGLTLFILTALTVRISMIHLGGWNAVAAIGIASIKASLVALFFMHLLYDKKIYLIVFATAIVILTIFITLTMFDTLRRGDLYEIRNQLIKPEAEIYKNMPQDTTSSSGEENR